MRVAPATAGRPLQAIAKMAAAFTASDLLRGAIRLVTSLVIARGLGRNGFGLWTLYAATASALTVALDLGFGVLLTREAARDQRDAAGLVTGALGVRLALFVPVAACVCVAPAIVGTTPGLAYAIAALAGAGITYGSIAPVFRAEPRRLVAILSIEAAGTVAQLAGAVVVIAAGGGVAALLQLAAGVLMVEAAAAALMLRFVAWEDRRPFASPAAAWRLLRRALPFAASGLVANAQARLGPLLLGVLSGPAELAAFGVATRLEGVARRLPYAAFGAALPVFSSPAGQTDGVRARFDALVRAFAIAAGLLLITGAGPLVRLTYGGAFVGAAVPLMWAGASLLPSLVNGGRKVYLNATGREQIVLRWSATALAIQIAAAVVLMPRFGASGAMAAIGLGEIAIWMPLRRADRRVVSGAELAASAGLGTPAPSLPL